MWWALTSSFTFFSFFAAGFLAAFLAGLFFLVSTVFFGASAFFAGAFFAAAAFLGGIVDRRGERMGTIT